LTPSLPRTRSIRRWGDSVVAAAEGNAEIGPDALAELGADLQEHAETIRRIASDLLATAEKQRGVIDLLRQRGSPRAVEVAPVVEEALGMVVDDCDETVDVTYREPVDGRARGKASRRRDRERGRDGE